MESILKLNSTKRERNNNDNYELINVWEKDKIIKNIIYIILCPI